MHLKLDEAYQQLQSSRKQFLQLFNHGTLSIEIYQPDKVDLQQPHTKDEVYVIISGSGEFINGSETMSFNIGDVLFVPAGREHRFINFTDDFATWVIFYGPDGGKKNDK